MRSAIVETKIFYQKNWQEKEQLKMSMHLDSKRNYLIYKRLVDFFAALVVILLVYPWLFPLLTILIKFTSRGPVFFKQKRVGFLGRIFWCYKFRTMYVNDAADARRASKDDPRVTPLGKFLRNTCLDEMPQFINVLMGQMSLVGPRPHMLKDSREFGEMVANYKFRSLARPGITGISQVRGYRGPASNFQSIYRRYQWDAYYVRNCSFRLDLMIVAETCLLMLRSFFNKSKPVPSDSAVLEHGNRVAIKKIA